MTIEEISILIGGKIEIAVLDYDPQKSTMKVTLESGWTKYLSGFDIYDCLGKIIMHRPDIKFLCKGAKLNVRPSSMSSQMSSGVVAYEHKLGVRASRKDLVNIFQYDDQDIINDPQLQTDFFHRWLKSLKE
jgi:hypothetical protein